MTLDTIFDMASLTKCLATATAVMQLYEAGKLDFDDPVAKYLPEFAVNGKQNVTIRELLTHYSGLPPDVDLKDAWGLAAPDKGEGMRRAMNSPLTTTPGTHFEYSDINYIVLGALVEKLSGEPLDIYLRSTSFRALKMVYTRYLPINMDCGADDLALMPVKPAKAGRKWVEPLIDPSAYGTWVRQGLRRMPLPPRTTTKAPQKPIPTSTICCAARYTIQQRGAWEAWQGRRESSPRQTMWRSSRRRYWIGWPVGPATSRSSARRWS